MVYSRDDLPHHGDSHDAQTEKANLEGLSLKRSCHDVGYFAAPLLPQGLSSHAKDIICTPLVLECVLPNLLQS